MNNFKIGDKVLYEGYVHTVRDVDHGYDYLALDGDRYITPNHEDNRCISAPMKDCTLVIA